MCVRVRRTCLKRRGRHTKLSYHMRLHQICMQRVVASLHRQAGVASAFLNMSGEHYNGRT